MKINDQIYGIIEVNEPVFEDLIATRAFQRLKGVTMGGIVALLDISPPSTRYDHSIGAMILTRKLGASLEEQIAALLHDVSHTAFSHVIDYSVDCPSNQNYHEKVKFSYLANTEIPSVLKKYGVDIDYVIDEDKHSILEQPIPRLCVDRIDYTLRDARYGKNINDRDIKQVVNDLIVDEGYPAFRSVSSAKAFADWYFDCSQSYWMNHKHCSLYHVCGEAIRAALNEGLMTESDFWDSDALFWEKMNLAGKSSTAIKSSLDLMSPKINFQISEPEHADFITHRKIRWVDPDVKIDGQKLPLSQFSEEFSDKIEKLKESYQSELPIKVR